MKRSERAVARSRIDKKIAQVFIKKNNESLLWRYYNSMSMSSRAGLQK